MDTRRRRTTAPTPALTGTELAAIEEYAYQRGYARWKEALRKDWAAGMADYAKVYPHAARVLMGLRDAPHFGVTGLETFVVTRVPVDRKHADASFQWRFAAFLAAPDLVRWERIAHLIIPGTRRTLWQAWVAVDGNAETGGWVEGRGFSRYPDPFTARRAVKAAVEHRVPAGLQALGEAHAAAPTLNGRESAAASEDATP
jgi:hypothetical protein